MKIDELKTPPIVGNYYLVPCKVVYVEHSNKGNFQKNIYNTWEDFSVITPFFKKIALITPIINRPHSDKENGQIDVHYHIDTRFIKDEEESYEDQELRYYKGYIIELDYHMRLKADFEIEYVPLKCIYTRCNDITDVLYIRKSKLKHKCIYKGKCPHRGMDLSQVTPFAGKIVCPLHGLEFDKNSGVLLTNFEDVIKERLELKKWLKLQQEENDKKGKKDWEDFY